jgi:hypothetical protein
MALSLFLFRQLKKIPSQLAKLTLKSKNIKIIATVCLTRIIYALCIRITSLLDFIFSFCFLMLYICQKKKMIRVGGVPSFSEIAVVPSRN